MPSKVIFYFILIWINVLTPSQCLVRKRNPQTSVWDNFNLIKADPFKGKSFVKLTLKGENGSNVLRTGANFGFSLAKLGDLDGNGVIDLLVGAYGESYLSESNETISVQAGAVYVVFISRNFSVISYHRISGEVFFDEDNGRYTEPMFVLRSNDNFGYSVTDVGDIDGDGTLSTGLV